MAGALKGITVEIGGDTTKLGKALSDVNSKSRSLQNELKGVNTLLKMDPKNVDLLRQKQTLLTQSIESTKEKLETLKTAQEQAQAQFERGEITEEQYRDLQREIVATEQKLESLTDEMKEFGSAGAQHVAQVGEKIKDVGGKVEQFGKGFSVISAGTGALLAGSMSAFVELDEGYDTIITKTGATGDALEELNTVADNIFGDMPVEMADVGTAVGEINTRFGYTGDQLEDLSRQFLQFSEINGVDLNTSIGTVDKVLEQFNLEASEAGNVLDLVTKKAQETGIGADTLLNSIQQNGATFKDMGIGVNEAVVMMSQFEANGVNVETALKGLKKATVEYAKEGISMKDGLTKTIDTIKNAKTETEALAEVEKLFGAKGANEMVKAIREGRLSVDDLSSSLEDYAGTVTNTFEGTLDPIDNAKVAMNNLKLAGSELGGVLQSVFAPMLTTLVNKLKDLVSWFGNLSPEMQKTITVSLLVTTALGPVIIAVGKLITALGSILTYAPKIATAFKTLTTTMSINPYVLLAGAIATLVVGIGAFIASTKKANDETAKAYKEIDEFNKKSREQKKAYDDMVEARKKSTQGIQAEYGYYSNLVDELSNIVDENGKVKDGYEARANTITGILSDALGEEISLDQLVADGKQKVIDKINELLTVKRAEAQLGAYEQSYTEAIQNSNTALNEYTKAESDHKKVSEDLTQAKKDLESAQKRYDEATDPRTRQMYKQQLDEEKRSVKNLTKEEKEASQTLKDKQDTYLGYVTTIENYEGVTSAIIEGDSAKINDALNLLINNFVSAENGTKASLEKQVTNAKTTLANLKSALENGSPGVTQTMVDNAQDMVNKATAELDKFEANAKTAGEDGSQAFADGSKSKKEESKKAGKEVGKSDVDGKKSTKSDQKKAGEDNTKEYAKGTKSKKEDAKKAGKEVGDSDTSGKKSTKADQKKAGEDNTAEYANGTKAKKEDAKKAGITIGSSDADGKKSTFEKHKSAGKDNTAEYASGVKSGSGNAKKAGVSVGNSSASGEQSASGAHSKAGSGNVDSYNKGMTSKGGATKNAGSQVANKGKNGLQSVKATSTGTNFVQGFINGMGSLVSSVWQKAWSIGKQALNALKSSIGEASPAKETIKSGEFFDRGLIVGIENKKRDVMSATANLGLSALASMRKAVGENSPWESTTESGENFDQGLIDGINNEKDKVDATAEAVGTNMANIAKSKLDQFRQSLAGFTGVPSQEKEKNKKAFDEAKNLIERNKNFGLITEAEYYSQLEDLRDKHLTGYSDAWIEVTQDLYQYYEDQDKEFTDQTKKNQEDADDARTKSQNNQLVALKRQLTRGLISEKEYYEQLAVLRDKFYSSGSDDWYTLDDEIFAYNKGLVEQQTEDMKQAYTDVQTFAEDKLTNLSGDIDSLSSKLKDHGSLWVDVGINAGDNSIEYKKLADIGSSNADLQRYANLLQQLKDRGDIPADFFAQIRDLSVEDGIAFAETLLNASDADFTAYINDWKTQQQLASDIANTLYADETEQVVTEIVDKFGALDDEFFGVGENSVAEWGDGFLTNITGVISKIKQNLIDKFSTALGGLNLTSIITSYGDNVPKMARGGIIDSPTIVEVGEDGREAIVPLEKNTGWIDKLASKITVNQPANITINTDAMSDKLQKIYDRLDRLQIVLDSGALVGETIDKIDAKLADRQLLSARGV